MKKVQEVLKEIKVLHGWEGFDVIPEVDEKSEDIWMLILYSSHGDDYLVVRTRDGHCYVYGLYEHLKYSEYKVYARKPQLYKELDGHAEVSNKIFFEFERVFQKSHMSFGYDKKYSSQHYAQFIFDEELKFIEELRKTAKAVFDYETHKRDIAYWLELNDIATDENIEKLKNAIFHNKVGPLKLIGVAGKIDCTDYERRILADEFKTIFVNDKLIDPEKVARFAYRDDWGEDIYQIKLDGFQPSKRG